MILMRLSQTAPSDKVITAHLPALPYGEVDLRHTYGKAVSKGRGVARRVSKPQFSSDRPHQLMTRRLEWEHNNGQGW
jgi:hypothetical protein